MFKMKKKLLKGAYGVDFDTLDKGGFGGGSGGKKKMFKTVIFSGFNNIEDAFDWLKTAIER